MSELSIIQDDCPWITSTGVVVDPIAKTATATGAVTVFSRKFVVPRMAVMSLLVSGTGSGVAGAGWRIVACNDYDPGRPVQLPGTFADITADFGAAGASTIPGVHQFAATFSGAVTDRFATWAFPWACVQFRLAQNSGTEVYTGQFFAGEV
jgi:hypothetical protein